MNDVVFLLNAGLGVSPTHPVEAVAPPPRSWSHGALMSLAGVVVFGALTGAMCAVALFGWLSGG